ncbi:MAG: efflux RND transporter periplasmic adaptor subunit [Gemmatimonadaceae bacterium]
MKARLSLLVVAVAAGCRQQPTNTIEATGSLELVEVDVTPQVPARVTKVWRQEGDRVKQGDTLLTLTQSTLPGDIAVQQAGVAAAQAQLSDLTAGPRAAEVATADANARAADAEATRAAQDLERITPLAAKGDVSQQQLDAARAAARSSAERRDAAREQARLVREGTRPEQIVAARARLASARAALSAAQQTAHDLVLTATVGGAVLSRHVEPGEMLAPGVSGMTIGDITRPYVRIYVNELIVPRVRLGDTASVTIDAFPNRAFRGQVVAVSDHAEFTPRVALTKDERADLMFGIKIQLTDSSNVLKSGLPVTVHLTPHPGQ